METTETLYTIRLNEADIERIVAALRTQARLALNDYTAELLNQGHTPYVGLLEEAYDDLTELANTFELVLPE
jgi:hypothetical protein